MDPPVRLSSAHESRDLQYLSKVSESPTVPPGMDGSRRRTQHADLIDGEDCPRPECRIPQRCPRGGEEGRSDDRGEEECRHACLQHMVRQHGEPGVMSYLRCMSVLEMSLVAWNERVDMSAKSKRTQRMEALQ